MTETVPSPRWRWSLLLPAGVLAAALAMQGLHFLRATPPPRAAHLARVVPRELAGWESREVPLGATEFLANEAEKVLNYDDVVSREFRRGGVSFGVYVAYWGAGKMPAQLVASHTPDRCWTENGWHCTAMKFNDVVVVDGAPWQPAEWRAFEPPLGGAPTYVMYWQLVDGRIYDYGRQFNDVPNPFHWWKDAVQQVLRGNREQYFIRLTASEPLERLWDDPGFGAVLRSLGQLGLAVATPPGKQP